jgi:hypothetical protein
MTNLTISQIKHLVKLDFKIPLNQVGYCHNPSLGLTIKTRTCKGAGQKGSPGVTSHAPESVGECEGMNPHTPK